MAFIDTIYARAKADKKTIVLPESMDKRTFAAAEKILKEGIANLIIIGTPEEIAENSKGYDITGATIVDPFNDPNKQKYIDKFVELRAKKGVTPEMAKEQMEKDYMYYACLMCKCGDADGAVSGACHSTGNTIRPALQLLKTKPGISSVSGFFLMEVPNCELGENGLSYSLTVLLIQTLTQRGLQKLQHYLLIHSRALLVQNLRLLCFHSLHTEVLSMRE